MNTSPAQLNCSPEPLARRKIELSFSFKVDKVEVFINLPWLQIFSIIHENMLAGKEK
jgi:hypothetical protein